MWSRTFWMATLERMIRGGAVAVGAVWLGGQQVFDTYNVNTWKDFTSVFISGAVLSLVLALIGNATTKNGPSFLNEETLSGPNQ